MSLLDILSGSLLLSGGLGLANTAYNLYTNKRDFDYQKAIQQQIFQREDTAIQRRMNDLKEAGINPNLAAGSAASAGAVVGRSSTNDVNMGSVLDTLMAKRQLDLQKLQQSDLKQDTQIKKYQFELGLEDFKMQRLQNLYALGFNPTVSFGKDGKLHIDGENRTNKFSDSKLAENIDYQLNSLKNSAALLQKQNDWYIANQIINAVSDIAGGISLFTPKSIRKLIK